MGIERQKLMGLQSRSLELGGAKRDKSTPTKDSDIGVSAKLYKSLAQGAAMATMALEGMSGGRGTQEMIDAQTAQIRAARGDAVRAGFNLDGFDLVVKDKVAVMKAKAAEEAADADLQPTLGDVPPNINWGNHSFSEKEAFTK